MPKIIRLRADTEETLRQIREVLHVGWNDAIMRASEELLASLHKEPASQPATAVVISAAQLKEVLDDL